MWSECVGIIAQKTAWQLSLTVVQCNRVDLAASRDERGF